MGSRFFTNESGYKQECIENCFLFLLTCHTLAIKKQQQQQLQLKIHEYAISQLVDPFNLPLPSFRVKAFKQLVNKDPGGGEQNRGPNKNPTPEPLTADQKQKVSF